MNHYIQKPIAGLESSARRERETVYPAALRAFFTSLAIVWLCATATVITAEPKGLSPAPFIAMGTLAALSACAALLWMLLRAGFEHLAILRGSTHER